MNIRWVESTRTFACAPANAREHSVLDDVRARTYGTYDHRRRTFYIPEMGWPHLYRLAGKQSRILQGFVRGEVDADYEFAHELDNGNYLRESQLMPTARKIAGSCGDFDDMGVGKTTSTLAAYRELRRRGEADGMVVLAPASCLGEWAAAARKFLNEDAFLLRKANQKPPASGIVCLSYAVSWRSQYAKALLGILKTGRWIVVFDEAHDLAGHTSKQFNACATWARLAKRRWVLTGTPVANYPDSFWPLYVLITQTGVSRESFVRYHTWDGDKIYREDRLRLFREHVAPKWSWRREKHEVLDLPPKTIAPVYLELTGEQARIYQRLVDDALLLVDDGSGWSKTKVEHALSLYTRILQVASHPMLVGSTAEPEAKTEALLAKLRGVGRQQVIVWSWRPRTVEWLTATIASECGWSVECVHGGTPQKNRDDIKERFQRGEVRCLVANPRAFGRGVNLQAGSVAIYWDLDWRFTDWKQSQDRIYRMGQEKPVTIIPLLSPFEQGIYDRLLLKERLGNALFGGEDTDKFTTDDIVALSQGLRTNGG